MRMSKGIVRRLDELGRITIPKEIRTTMGMQDKAQIDMYVSNGALCMERYEPNELSELINQIPESKQDEFLNLVKEFIGSKQ